MAQMKPQPLDLEELEKTILSYFDREKERLLKEEHGQLLYLILAKFTDVKMANTDLFDEIWEFEKND